MSSRCGDEVEVGLAVDDDEMEIQVNERTREREGIEIHLIEPSSERLPVCLSACLSMPPFVDL